MQCSVTCSVFSALLLATAMTAPAAAQGTPVCEGTPILPPDPTCLGYFTSDIGMNGSGDLAIVGEIFGDACGCSTGPGLAHIYTISNGQLTLEQTIQHSNPGAGEAFGASVDIDGDFAIVAAPGDDSGAGAAYMFKYDSGNWAQHGARPHHRLPQWHRPPTLCQ